MISKEFLENIESGDVITVRSALLDDLIIDRTFKTFDEDFAAAIDRLNLLVQYDGEPFETDSEKWDKEYLNKQKVALMVNFSNERINHLKAVIAKVMPPEAHIQRKEASTTHPSTGSRTGRTVTNVKMVESERKADKQLTMPCSTSQSTTHSTTGKSRSMPKTESGRTGRKVINETPTEKESSDNQNSKLDGIGTALIVVGAVTAVVGVAVAEPLGVGAGIIVAGAGVCVKVSNRR